MNSSRMAVSLCFASLAVSALAETTSGAAPWNVAPQEGGTGYCRARLAGSDINLVMIINDKDKLVLIGAHADWRQSGEFQTTIAVDDSPPVKLKADAVGPLVLTGPDDQLTEKLRAARSIDWTLPSGKYHVMVEGLGAAMDGIRTCQASVRSQQGSN